MGGRGSGGGRSGGGGASKAADRIKKEIQDEKLRGEIAYSQNQAYKYDDEAYDLRRQALAEKAMAREFKKRKRYKRAEEYEQYAKESNAKAKEAEKKSLEYKKKVEKLTKTKEPDIPRYYAYNGDKGKTRRVFKSPQEAVERWNSERKHTVSTSLADQPSFVKSPNGGYSVIPHNLLKKNNLKEIAPSEMFRLADQDKR